MKLLPYYLTYIKDAARAVKRICKEEFKEAKDTALTELLGMSMLVVTMYAMRIEGDQHVLHVWCTHREEAAICPRCGAISETIHDESERCVRHMDIWGKRTFLHFYSRRFDCDQCGKAFTEELSFVEAHRRQTIDFERHVYESCLGGNKKKVAVSAKLSQSTVKEIFNRWAKLKDKNSKGLMTRVLGIDELSLKKRHKQFVLVISDIEKKCILAVLPSREKEVLGKWIDTLTCEQRKAIRFVSIDMWAPYQQTVNKKLSHAKVVVDRFHVMKQLNHRITQLRTCVQKNTNPEVASILKGSRWILVRNRSELSKDEEVKLQKVLESCPELRVLYLLKEEFRMVFEKIDSREKAKRFLTAWILKAQYTGNRFLAKFLTTLKNWWDEILNYRFS